MGKVLTDTTASPQDIVQWRAYRGGLGIVHKVSTDALGEIEHRSEEWLARRERRRRIMSQARTTRDVGGRKEVLYCLQDCSAALVVQPVAHCFPGWGGIRLKHSARRDFDRAPGGHRQSPVRLLY